MRDEQVNIEWNSFAEAYFQQCEILIFAKDRYCEIHEKLNPVGIYGFSVEENRIIYQGMVPEIFSLEAAFTLISKANVRRKIQVGIEQNGNLILQEAPIFFTAEKETAAHLILETKLSPGDFLKVVVSNTEGAEPIIVRNFKISIHKK